MSVPTNPSAFDYGAIAESDRHSLEFIAVEVDCHKKAIAAKVLAIGKHLTRAREIFGQQDGGFRAWLRDRCGISRAWAYAAIQAFEKFGECPTVGHIQTSAIFMLACDNVPEEARQEAIALADSGVTVTRPVAREIIEAHREAGPDHFLDAEEMVPEVATEIDKNAVNKPCNKSTDSDSHRRNSFQGHEFELTTDVSGTDTSADKKAVTAGAREIVESRPFAVIPSLPADVDDAYGAMKLCVLRHKLTGWQEISREDLIQALNSLIDLARRPADAA